MIAQNRATRKEHCNLRTGALSKNAMTFTTHSRTTRTSQRLVRELDLPARSASRRVANLPYLSLGPLFKGRDTALTSSGSDSRPGRGEQLVSQLAKRFMGWVA